MNNIHEYKRARQLVKDLQGALDVLKYIKEAVEPFQHLVRMKDVKDAIELSIDYMEVSLSQQIRILDSKGFKVVKNE